MKRVLKFLGKSILVGALIFVGLYLFGPREPIDPTITFDTAQIGEDIDGYLEASESGFDDIVDGTQKRVIWAGAAGAQTDVAVVYLHGWGASSEEIRPVPDQVAAHLGANLYFARLKGHGRGDLAMSEPTMNDWMQDLAEAMEIGRRIGKRVVLVTTSTGGSLAIAGAAQAETREGMAGIVLVSPNFGPVDPMAELANWPLARTWVPALVGEWREWEPHNELQGKYWTTRTQNVAALPMMALVKHVREVDLGAIDLPILVIYSRDDMVVSAEKTEAAMERWGGPKEMHVRVMSDADTPSHHVIAGDIMSPTQTAGTVEIISSWADGVLGR